MKNIRFKLAIICITLSVLFLSSCTTGGIGYEFRYSNATWERGRTYITGIENKMISDSSCSRSLSLYNAIPVPVVKIPERHKGDTVIGVNIRGANIDTLKIPKTIERIDGRDYAEIRKFEVDEDNEFYKSIEGVLFSKDGKELCCYPHGRPYDTYVIPDGVEIVNCSISDLDSLELPSSLVSVQGSFSDIERLVYKGTMTEWNFVVENSPSLNFYNVEKVVCLDEELMLSQKNN